jgi:NAD(P)-dependent dehydrogenase (short-subunit alcohol dehydrogenase family)
MHDSPKQIALVTGANKGIGLEIARQLAKAGMSVLLGARNVGLGEAAATKLRAEGRDVRFVELDLTRPETIEAAKNKIEADFHRLDVLVNNAGILDRADGQPGVVDPAVVRRAMDTNFFGTFEVTRALLPLLRRSKAGRIVNVSSGLGSLTLNADPRGLFAQYQLLGYNTSKAAMNMLTILLANELKDTPIKVNSANPGYTATDMNQYRGTQTIEEGAAEPVRLALLPADGPSGGLFSTAGPQPW